MRDYERRNANRKTVLAAVDAKLRLVPATRPASGSASSSARSSALSVSVRRGGVLLQPRAALRARDRDDVLALREQPGERDLRRRRVAPRGDGLHASRPAPVRVHRLGLEARVVLAEVAGGRTSAAAVRRSGSRGRAARTAGTRRRGPRTTGRPRRTRRASTASPRTGRTRRDGSRARARSRSTLTSDRPSAPTLPCATSSAIAPQVSSSGTSGSTRCSW